MNKKPLLTDKKSLPFRQQRGELEILWLEVFYLKDSMFLCLHIYITRNIQKHVHVLSKIYPWHICYIEFIEHTQKEICKLHVLFGR